MKALAQSGLRTVLFSSPPSSALLENRFSDLACVGIAGTSRAMSPDEMDAELEPVLDALWVSGGGHGAHRLRHLHGRGHCAHPPDGG